MKSHELAKKLLEMPDAPVFLQDVNENRQYSITEVHLGVRQTTSSIPDRILLDFWSKGDY